MESTRNGDWYYYGWSQGQKQQMKEEYPNLVANYYYNSPPTQNPRDAIKAVPSL